MFVGRGPAAWKLMRRCLSLKFSVILFLCSSRFLLFSLSSFLIESSSIISIELVQVSSVSFGFDLVFDKVSLSFGAVVSIIAGRVYSFSYRYIREDPFKSRFHWILLCFVASINLLIFSGRIFFLFLGWDGLGITSFALIIYYQSGESLSAGFQTLMINRIGDSLIVLSRFLFVILGQFSFIHLPFNRWIYPTILILIVAGLTKRAQYPFSSWLPAAIAAPTPVRALVHSSTLVTAGIFLIIRLRYWVPLPYGGCQVLLFCGAVTCLLGGWAATYENDIKKIIALRTLSQLGVIIFCLGLGLPSLSLFHLYTHALFKALLFIAAGHVLMRTFGSQDIRLLGGLSSLLPFTSLIFGVRSFCLVGAPFLRAFYSKHLILEKIIIEGAFPLFRVALIIIATFFTAKYVSRSVKCVIWSNSECSILSKRRNWSVILPISFLAIGAISSGKFIYLADLSNLEIGYLPRFLGHFINFVTIFGVVIGVLSFSNPVKNFPLRSMFFLTSIISKGSYFIVPFLSKVRNLDHGWLEPRVVVNQRVYGSGSFISSLFYWPVKGFTMSRGLIIFFSVFIIVFTFNF